MEAEEFGINKALLKQLQDKYKSACDLMSKCKDDKIEIQDVIESFRNVLALYQGPVQKCKITQPRFYAITTVLKLKMEIMKNRLGRIQSKFSKSEQETQVLQDLCNFFGFCEMALKILKEYPEAILVTLFICNELGNLCYLGKEYSQAAIYLLTSTEIYENFLKLSYSGQILSVDFLFHQQESDPIKKLHMLNVTTNKYLAKLFGKMDLIAESLKFKHEELNRYLDLPWDAIDWVSKVARTSKMFLQNGCFWQVNYYLSGAEQVLDKYRKKLLLYDFDLEPEDFRERLEKIYEGTLDIDIWIANCNIQLMQRSLECFSEEINENNNMKKLKFEKIEADIIVDQKIPYKYLDKFEDVTVVFLNAVKLLENAKIHFTFQKNVKKYMEIVDNMSMAFKMLSCFVKNDEHKTNLLKRSIDILKDLADDLENNSCNKNEDLIMTWFKIGENWNYIFDLNFILYLKNPDVLSEASLNLNDYRELALCYLNKFLNSQKIDKNEMFSEKINRILAAHAKVGDLINKYVTNDVRMTVKNMMESLTNFNFVVSYCQENSITDDLLPGTLPMSKRYQSLIRQKIGAFTLEPSSYNCRDWFNLISKK